MDKEVMKKQNRKVTLFALFLSLVSIGVLVLGFLVVSSNKVLMIQSISNISNKISNFSNNLTFLDKISNSDKIGIKSNIIIDNGDDIKEINIDLLENKSANKSRLDIVGKDNDKEILNGNIILFDNKLYTFIKDITDKYYFTDFDYQSIINSLSKKDYEKLLDYGKDSINQMVKNDDIKKEKVVIKYNDKDKKVTKLTYDITNKKIYNFFDIYIKKIKSDTELYKNIANFLTVDTSDLDKYLDKYLNNILQDDNSLYEYSIYYYGFNKIFRYEFVSINDGIKVFYQENSDNTNVVVTDIGNNKELANLILKSTDDSVSFDILCDNDKDRITGTYNKDKIIFTYNKSKYEIAYNLVSKNDSYDVDINISITDTNNKKVSIKCNNTFYFDKDVSFDSTDSISINDLTADDIFLMLEKISDSELFKMINEEYDIPIDMLPYGGFEG